MSKNIERIEDTWKPIENLKILTILGARPQFIKASALTRAIRERSKWESTCIEDIIVHTGQHYDDNMSRVFFEELELPSAKYNLGIGSLSHGAMTGRMIEACETIMKEEKPNVALMYGDTNSTLAGAIAASKLNIPIAHVEAGLRSRRKEMPEETNRIVADVLSNSLYCPTEEAEKNLAEEGIKERVFRVGDVMLDVALNYSKRALENQKLEKWGLDASGFVLCTLHRAENTEDLEALESIFRALRVISKETTVLLPLHPRTNKTLKDNGRLSYLDGLKIVEPLSYLEMIGLEMASKAIFTDSGGVQKEAFFHKVPCITLRDETEWTETLSTGWNTLVGSSSTEIQTAWSTIDSKVRIDATPYGDGTASSKILSHLVNLYG